MADMRMEVCQIRWEPVPPVDGYLHRPWSSHYVAYIGNQVYARSEAVNYETPLFETENKRLQNQQQYVARKEAAYQQVLHWLLDKGWEPLGSDEDGRVMSFKRMPKEGATPSLEATSKTDMLTELERLGKLKTEGLLSEDEFRAAKAKLLGL